LPTRLSRLSSQPLFNVRIVHHARQPNPITIPLTCEPHDVACKPAPLHLHRYCCHVECIAWPPKPSCTLEAAYT
jgi:hypothetical protein